MAETDSWPTKEASSLEAFPRESAAAVAPLSEHELDAARRAAGAIDEDLHSGVPALIARTPTEPGAPADVASALKIYQRRVASFAASAYTRLRSDWPSPGNRWTIPALALVILIQSVWLIKDRVRNEIDSTPNPATAPVDASSNQSTRATSGVQAGTQQRAEAVTRQAASADTRAATNNPTAAKQVAPVAAPGSVSIAVPFQVEVYENGRFVGIMGEKGVPLAPGSHRIELVNESLRYRSSHTVAITSGRTTQMKVALPTGRLHLNAAPWADVEIDGDSVGETPLANIEVPIGSHRVTFRHPQLGEQTRNIVVTAESTTRIGVDLQK